MFVDGQDYWDSGEGGGLVEGKVREDQQVPDGDHGGGKS